jgi:hypothetical protein
MRQFSAGKPWIARVRPREETDRDPNSTSSFHMRDPAGSTLRDYAISTPMKGPR